MVKEWAKHMLYVLHFKKFPIRLTAEIIYNAISGSFFFQAKNGILGSFKSKKITTGQDMN